MSDSPYRQAPPGMPTRDEVRRRECRHLEYRQATPKEQGDTDYALVCLDCGARLIW